MKPNFLSMKVLSFCLLSVRAGTAKIRSKGPETRQDWYQECCYALRTQGQETCKPKRAE